MKLVGGFNAGVQSSLPPSQLYMHMHICAGWINGTCATLAFLDAQTIATVLQGKLEQLQRPPSGGYCAALLNHVHVPAYDSCFAVSTTLYGSAAVASMTTAHR